MSRPASHENTPLNLKVCPEIMFRFDSSLVCLLEFWVVHEIAIVNRYHAVSIERNRKMRADYPVIGGTAHGQGDTLLQSHHFAFECLDLVLQDTVSCSQGKDLFRGMFPSRRSHLPL